EITLAGQGLEVRRLEAGGKYAPAPGGRSVVYLSAGKMMLDGAEVRDADGVKFRSDEFVTVAEQPVRGQIEVRRSEKGLIAINVLPLEDYLAAVLGSEMPRSFPLEALKAQAVAARTYAVRRKIEAWGKPYHLGATVLHQVYGGAKAEDAKTRQIVKATEGEVLVWKMEPIEAYFHASCGGHTESGSEALGRPLPYLKSVDCACDTQPRTQWELKLGASDFKSLAKGVKDLEVLERTPTGRAKKVLLASASGKVVVSGVELRKAVGYDKLRSLDFEAERKGGGFQLKGRGHGHGTGMCQWGAKAYAEQGWGYRKILEHYYVGAEIRKMY
ncbi:MAG: SpoIID/LytB domain-containing protein, partial [Deltaproteobacteria bacterium]|nr:SpoIID/LytB domain-containing protein [Deltaproteobacteria bacterium]